MNFASSKSVRGTITVIGALASLVLATVAVATPAEAGRGKTVSTAVTWAPAATAAIHPGTMMYTEGAQCTANFVFTDANQNVYVGYAAHCAGLGAATDTNGCDAETLKVGTPVTFNEGGSLLSDGTVVGHGTLAYTSWGTMQARNESNDNVCAYNDFALVKVAAADVAKVNPSVPFWGGPVGIDTNGTEAGDQLYTYGNSSLRAGIEALSPHTGFSLGDDPADGGWSHPLYTVTPGVPGDSGSGFLSADGSAVGTLSTLGLAPLPASNNIGDLAHELAYAQAYSGIAGLTLANGTEPFEPVL